MQERYIPIAATTDPARLRKIAMRLESARIAVMVEHSRVVERARIVTSYKILVPSHRFQAAAHMLSMAAA